MSVSTMLASGSTRRTRFQDLEERARKRSIQLGSFAAIFATLAAAPGASALPITCSFSGTAVKSVLAQPSETIPIHGSFGYDTTSFRKSELFTWPVTGVTLTLLDGVPRSVAASASLFPGSLASRALTAPRVGADAR